jgi:hypothetical protein
MEEDRMLNVDDEPDWGPGDHEPPHEYDPEDPWFCQRCGLNLVETPPGAPCKPKHRGWYVNVYRVDLAYGGPEEGGWWYKAGEVERCLPALTRAGAERILARVRPIIERWNEGRRPLSSVLSDGAFECAIEREPARDFPRRRPHYE